MFHMEHSVSAHSGLRLIFAYLRGYCAGVSDSFRTEIRCFTSPSSIYSVTCSTRQPSTDAASEKRSAEGSYCLPFIAIRQPSVFRNRTASSVSIEPFAMARDTAKSYFASYSVSRASSSALPQTAFASRPSSLTAC